MLTVEDVAEARILAGQIIEAALAAGLTDGELTAVLMFFCGAGDEEIAAAMERSRQRAQQLRSNALHKIAHYLRVHYDLNVTVQRKPYHSHEHHTRLDEALVRKIRALVASGIPKAHVARQIGVSESTVHDVVKRNTWAHVV